MPTTPTAEIRETASGLVARVTLRGKSRKTFALPTCADHDAAETRGNLLARLAQQFRRVNVLDARGLDLLDRVASATDAMLPHVLTVVAEHAGGELDPIDDRNVPTFREVAQLWTSGELHTRFPDHVRAKDSELDATRLEKLCALDVGGSQLGDIAIDRVTLDHTDAALRDLPSVAKRPATRRHYGQLIARVLSLAVYPLKLITATPIPRGWLPKPGKPPAYPYLHPVDDAQLLGCVDIPIAWRVYWGFLAREGSRAGEATGMRLGYEIDLDRGTISLDENKSDDPRTWAMGDDVCRALTAWCAMRKIKRGALVFTDPDGDPITVAKLARTLRSHIATAKIDRPELTEKGTNRGRLRAHDLRGTFVTLSLAAGRTETWVSDRTGHRSSEMIQRYRRQARSAAELGLGWLSPLDSAIPELSSPRGATNDGPRMAPLSGGEESAARANAAKSKSQSRSGGMADAADSKDEPPPRVSASSRDHDPEIAHERSLELTKGPSGGHQTGLQRIGIASGDWDHALHHALRARATELADELPADAVERALRDALAVAVAERRDSDAALLARELDARKRARTATIDLASERAKRGTR